MPLGCCDGTEVCQLVGSYILSKSKIIIGREVLGLYQDDGLGVFCSLSGPQVDRKQKQMEERFRQCKLSITVEINLKNLNFVDVLFDLTIETFKRT